MNEIQLKTRKWITFFQHFFESSSGGIGEKVGNF